MHALRDRSFARFAPRSRSALAAAALVGAWLVSSSAEAAPDNHRFRFHVESDLFNFGHLNPDGSTGDNANFGGFGVGRPPLQDSTLGLGTDFIRPMWGLGFGYVFARSRAVVGATVSFIVEGAGQGDNNTTLVGGQLVPYFRWVFLPGRIIRPYVGARLGFGGTTTKVENDTANQTNTLNVIYPQVGFGGGVHIFPADFFSVDLGLHFDYFAPFVGSKAETPGGTADDDLDKAADVINLAIVQAGISVWFR